MANGLGRGLGSLIPNKTNPPKTSSSAEVSVSADEKGRILKIAVEKIKVNPMQPRKKFTDFKLEELVSSIKEFGVIQPLIVTKEGDVFELIAGERRLRASKAAGLKEIPVILRDARAREKLEVALIENVQRENLNPIDLAEAYKQLMDEFGLNQEDVAKKMGKARSSVANIVRMLTLPDEIQLALIDGKLTEGHAKYLLGLESQEKQLSLFRRIMRGNLSVSDTNEVAKRMSPKNEKKTNINYHDHDKEFALREFFGAKAAIRRKRKGGQVVIDFYSDEELKGIMEKIG